MQYRIPLYRLDRLYQSVQDSLEATLLEVARSAVYAAHGPRARALEEQVQELMSCRHAIVVRSGTTAIYLALVALGVGPGDEVITVANSAVGTTSAISQAGADVVLADIDPRTYNMNPESVEQLITKSTRALMPVHLYGRPAEMGPLMDTAARHNIPVVEDACLAFGATYRGKMCGSIGTVGCHSFATRKIMGAVGAGGVVVTNDDEVADRVRCLAATDDDASTGYNLGLDEFQSAAVLCKLPKLSEWIERRRAIAAHYSAGLAGAPVVVSPPDDDGISVFRNYVLRVPAREQIRRFLGEKGIETGLHYCPPLHKRPYSGRPLRYDSLVHTETCGEEMVNLPVHPFLRDDEVEDVVQSLNEALARFC